MKNKIDVRPHPATLGAAGPLGQAAPYGLHQPPWAPLVPEGQAAPYGSQSLPSMPPKLAGTIRTSIPTGNDAQPHRTIPMPNHRPQTCVPLPRDYRPAARHLPQPHPYRLSRSLIAKRVAAAESSRIHTRPLPSDPQTPSKAPKPQPANAHHLTATAAACAQYDHSA